MESEQIANERLRREKVFHDERFMDDSLRREKVGRFYQITDRLLADYANALHVECQGKRYLEYGCGTGSQAFYLAESGAKVIGIDISATAIELARGQAASLIDAEEPQFLEMDAQQLAFADESVDVVCGSGILHHLNLGRSINEIYRVLAPGGQAHFIEPLGHNIAINVYRNKTPELRSADERPLMNSDLSYLESVFPSVKLSFYYLSALAASAISRSRFPRTFRICLRILEGVDSLIFRAFPFMRKQAWFCRIELCKT